MSCSLPWRTSVHPFLTANLFSSDHFMSLFIYKSTAKLLHFRDICKCFVLKNEKKLHFVIHILQFRDICIAITPSPTTPTGQEFFYHPKPSKSHSFPPYWHNSLPQKRNLSDVFCAFPYAILRKRLIFNNRFPTPFSCIFQIKAVTLHRHSINVWQ